MAAPERARVGMLFFLSTEAMFFAGLISAFIVLSATPGAWPPAGQPRLPPSLAAFNILVLTASGGALVAGLRPLALLLGVIFLALQGTEWARLVSYGWFTARDIYSGTFTVLIGTHAVHASAGLVWLWFRGDVPARWYWYFVVGLWPILYLLVYLR